LRVVSSAPPVGGYGDFGQRPNRGQCGRDNPPFEKKSVARPFIQRRSSCGKPKRSQRRSLRKSGTCPRGVPAKQATKAPRCKLLLRGPFARSGRKTSIECQTQYGESGGPGHLPRVASSDLKVPCIAPVRAWPDGSEPEHGPKVPVTGGFDLSLANEKKRRYSFVTEFLNEKVLSRWRHQLNRIAASDLCRQDLQGRVFPGLCTTAVAARPAAGPPTALALLEQANKHSDGWTDSRPFCRPLAIHLPLRSKGSGALFADRGHTVVVSDLMLFESAEAPSVH